MKRIFQFGILIAALLWCLPVQAGQITFVGQGVKGNSEPALNLYGHLLTVLLTLLVCYFPLRAILGRARASRAAMLSTVLLCVAPAWAAVAYFNNGAIQGTTTTTDAQAAPPSSTQADDIAVVSCFVRNTGAAVTVSGYTQLGTTLTTSTGRHTWWRLRATGALGTATCDKDTSADSSAIMFVFRGAVPTGDPFVAVGTPEEDSPAATFTVTAISTTAANQMVILLSNYEDDDLASFAVTATDPAAYTEDYNEVTTSTSDSALSIAYEVRATSGSSGTFTVDYSGNGTDQFGSLAVVLDVCTTCVTYNFVGVGYDSSCSACVSDPTSFLVNPVAGHLIYAIGFIDDDDFGGTTHFSDSWGNTWRRCSDGTVADSPDIDSNDAAHRQLSCAFVLSVSTSGGSMTVTAASTSCSDNCVTTGVIITEWSGPTTWSWDSYGNRTNSTSTAGSNNALFGSVTPVGSRVLLLGSMNNAGSSTTGTTPLAWVANHFINTFTYTNAGAIEGTQTIDAGSGIKYVGLTTAFCGDADCTPPGGGGGSAPKLTLMGVGD